MQRKPSGRGESFESAWRRRFREYAHLRDDDAGIAGWSPTGLEARFRFFARHWPGAAAGGLWLDVGCGAGTYSRYLAETGQSVVGFDYSLPSVRKANERDSAGIVWAVADARCLPVIDGEADGVLCFGVTQALDSSVPLMDELARVTAPDGVVWVDALNAYCLPHMLSAFVRRLRGRPRHLRYERPWRLRRTVRQAGFEPVRLMWLPILPGGLKRFQKCVEFEWVRILLHKIAPVGMLASHSVVVEARRQRDIQ